MHIKMDEGINKSCILLLIGLPGSGKTYLTSFLSNYFENSSHNLKYNILPFSYDALMANLETSNCVNLKDKRKEILNIVQNAIEKIKLQNDVCDRKSIEVVNRPPKYSTTCTLFVIDDNMYYRSMRYEYYKISKLMKVGFCQIYMEATLEESLIVNSKRNHSSQVTEATISRMNNLIEMPDLRNSWEKLSISIPFHISLENSDIMHKIECLINKALLTSSENSETDNSSSSGIKKQNLITNSLVHLVDLSLRSLIKNNIKSFMTFTKDEVRCYAEKLNAQKLNILNELRTKSLILPQNLIEALEDQNSHNKEFIHNYFQNLLTNNDA